MNDCISNSPADMLANTLLNETSRGLWIVSGSSGAGKTIFCAELIAQAKNASLSVGGILCPAVYEGGEKVDIDQIDIRTGERRRLGTRSGGTGETTVGCWQMDESVLAWGNAILASLKDEDLIVIDELGPLELEEGCGYQEALRLLDESRYQVAVVAVRPALLSLVRLRWPDVQVYSLEGESQ